MENYNTVNIKLQRLVEDAVFEENPNGFYVENWRDFVLLIGEKSTQIIHSNKPSVDNCFEHKIRYSGQVFKTLTTKIEYLEPIII